MDFGLKETMAEYTRGLGQLGAIRGTFRKGYLDAHWFTTLTRAAPGLLTRLERSVFGRIYRLEGGGFPVKGKHFSVEGIGAVLKQVEIGVSVVG